MLSQQETQLLAALTTTGRTPDVIDFLRALAKTARIADIVDAIAVVVQNCQINGAAKRAFLAARVPGILTNNFFTLLDRDWYEAFVQFTVQNPTWADPVSAAASARGVDLEAAVSKVEADVRATM